MTLGTKASWILEVLKQQPQLQIKQKLKLNSIILKFERPRKDSSYLIPMDQKRSINIRKKAKTF